MIYILTNKREPLIDVSLQMMIFQTYTSEAALQVVPTEPFCFQLITKAFEHF